MSRKIRVLVADDSQAVLIATSDLLEDHPEVEVIAHARNVEEAVRLTANHKPDLALIDAWLAGGGVEEVLRKITTLSPATLVAALASSQETELSRKLDAAGALGCYEKADLSLALPEILSITWSRVPRADTG